MIDCKGDCLQGRGNCPTPYTCGIYTLPEVYTANSDGSNPDLPVTMHDTPLDHARTLFLAIALIAAAGCIGLIFGVIAGLR